MAAHRETELQKCLNKIEEKLAWGDGKKWSSADFQQLSDLIHQHTKILLSASTLKRIWGRVKHDGKPATSTLDALAKFIGHENWRAFVVYENNHSKQEEVPPKKIIYKKNFLIWGLGIVALSFLVFSFLYKTDKKNTIKTVPLAAKDFAFSSQPIVRNIPNSVVFTYDASKAPDDSIFIQQNWDPRRREKVLKENKKHTSIYYEPGYYTAKLVVSNQVVSEHPLLIPTAGWLGTIDHSPVPIYLKQHEFIQKEELNASISSILSYINPKTEQSIVKYFNVGNFEPLTVADFSFTTDIKNNYAEGNKACQLSQIMLITDNMPIVIPLSVKGCVSALNIMSVDQAISGKNADLSKFGVDFSNWVNVRCQSDGRKIQYYVDNDLAYELPLISKNTKIVGLAFIFNGSGAAKKIMLRNKNNIVFQDF
ncbi:hypothetical protein [Olivibacter domesticus]|uniref:PKD domain-containing protein n=1 Tax=Olivibacter domesticus TaxID=407022 RepID=A0A1H7JFE7_OLID1|nr:hypothetical protein [Olivibacter domesticus]SEK73226.1 hypothetical protein SAMN05661044_00997 [Olivibacter domesticus]